MNLTIRIFAMTVALAGLVSSSFSSASTTVLPSHLSAYSSGPGPWSLPVPTCDPSLPTCGQYPGGGGIISVINF